LLVIDLQTGTVLRRYRFPQPLGSLSLAGTLLLSQTTTTLHAYNLAGFGVMADGFTWPVEARRALWNDLDAPEESRREHALRLFDATTPGMAPLLKKELRPVPASDPQPVVRLLKDLADPLPEVRVRATEELEKYKDLAEPGLKEILASKPPLDLARRAEEILGRLPTVLPEQRRTLAAVRALERWGSPEARELLETMAKGEPRSRITREARAALERLKTAPP
jgi:HEAT repeat protein